MKAIRFQVSVTLDADAVGILARLLEEIVGKTTELARSGKLASGTAAGEQNKPPRKMTPKEASEHALLGGQKMPDDMGLLVNSRDVAKLLNISERTLWAQWNSGKMPKPIRIGQRVLWGYEELRAWVTAGCPAQEDWEWPTPTESLQPGA